MIILNLARVARAKGIKKPVKSLRDMGISAGMASVYMKPGAVKEIALANLEKIFIGWHTTPHECFEYKKEPSQATLPPEHPIHVMDHSNEPLVDPAQLWLKASARQRAKWAKEALGVDEKDKEAL